MVKGGLAAEVPFKCDIFLGKFMEWPGDTGEVIDKSAIEVGKSNEALEFCEVSRGRPVRDSFEFGGVHT